MSYQPPRKPEQRALVAALFAQGLSIEKIAERIGRNRRSVRAMANRMGLRSERARGIRRTLRRKAIKAAAERVFGHLTVRDVVNHGEVATCASEL